MRVRVSRVEGAPVITFIYCQSPTELNEKCSRLGLMAFFPSLLIRTLAQSWYFSCFSAVAERMETRPRSACTHWEEEGKAIRTAELEPCVTARQHSPCFHHHNLSTAGIRTSTFTTANRRAGVLCETDGDTERQCKYLDF